jgi:RNA polymerase sigma factor (sigma-70 family)
MNNFTDFKLEENLRFMGKSKSNQYEQCWRAFLKNYKNFIYHVVTKRVLTWNVPRLRMQLSDVVNDIVSEIFITLHKSITSFRETDDEKKFLFWLTTICNRTASHFLRKQFISTVIENEIQEIQEYYKVLQTDVRWELYENIVKDLREYSGKSKRNLERDITLFNLYTISDFSHHMIELTPCFDSIGNRVVDNVINRTRDVLKAKN